MNDEDHDAEREPAIIVTSTPASPFIRALTWGVGWVLTIACLWMLKHAPRAAQGPFPETQRTISVEQIRAIGEKAAAGANKRIREKEERRAEEARKKADQEPFLGDGSESSGDANTGASPVD